MLFIGVVELLGGTAIGLGFLTRLAALLAAIEMALVYPVAHASHGIIPLENRGRACVARMKLMKLYLWAIYASRK